MFHKLFSRFFQRQHYWRDVGFDELTELYTSMMLRSLAMGMVGIFVPIYLYQSGFPVWQILFFYMWIFVFHMIVSIVSAFVIARYGPKHTILLSYVFQAISMVGLIYINTYNLPLLLVALLFGIAQAFFFTAFHINFSKIKHTDHGGKEVGWMYVMQKVGAIAGPALGGVVAYLFGSQYIFVMALVLLFAGIIPLFLTSEPVKTHQKLSFNLKISAIKRDLVSYCSLQLENTITLIVWPLFIGVMIFRDNPYIQLGGVASISIVASLIIAKSIGSMIDKRKGRQLLQFGAVINAVLHLFRPSATGFSSVLAVNLVNEGVTIAYTMPMTKGLYDAADELPGYRIVYICTVEAVGGMVRVLFYGAAAMAAYSFGVSQNLFTGLFIVGAIASLMITTERFRALRA